MILEKIVIKSFGTLTDMTLEFSEKVNVIEGRNEAGKTTIAAFIKYMLYGFDRSLFYDNKLLFTLNQENPVDFCN